MQKIKARKAVTEQEYRTAAEQYVKLELQKDKMQAKVNAELEKLTAKYDGPMQELGDQMKAQAAIIHEYAEANKETMFTGEKKSLECNGANIGFKTGSPAVMLLGDEERSKDEEKSAWEEATAKVKKLLPDYIRTKEEIEKPKLIADREDTKLLKLLAKCGLKIDQTETFFIKVIKKKEK
jgi:phage host-nuclease inhibitor protein Gam